MATGGALQSLREDIAAEADRYHVPAQIARFLTVFAAALGLQMATHGSITGWSDLRAAVLAAAPVAYRQWRRTMPVPAVHAVLDKHEQAAEAEPTPHT
jgi:hypothetical protein